MNDEKTYEMIGAKVVSKLTELNIGTNSFDALKALSGLRNTGG